MSKVEKIDYIVAIGGANMDLYGRSDKHLILEDSNMGTLKVSAGGVVRNIAENLARLSSNVVLLSAVGDDIWGKELLESTQQAGVDIKYCLKVKELQTSTYLSLHEPDGEMKVALNDMAITEYINMQYLSRHERLIKNAKILVVDTNLSNEALEYIFSLKHGCVFVDPVSMVKAERIKPYLAYINTLKPNRMEAAYLADMKINTQKNLKDATEKLHEKGIDNIFISIGSEGAYISDGNISKHLPIVKKQINNVTGAGDAIMAALVHGSFNNWSWEKVCAFAMMAAHITVSSSSTINPNISEKIILEQMEQL